MCLLLFALDAHPDYRLVLASNRDEYYARPAAPLARWPLAPNGFDAPEIVGGLDLEAGGSWLGLRRDGAWAAVTNVRLGAQPQPAPRSRGHLVGEFLRGRQTPEAFITALAPTADHYGGFNLVLSDGSKCLYYSNRNADGPIGLASGVHGLANAGLDCDWPKISGGKAALHRVLQSSPTPESLLALLRDDRQPPDDQLPDTGIGLDMERALARRFISSESYGTRASTIVLVDRLNRARVWEQSFAQGGHSAELRHLDMTLVPPSK